MKLQLVVLTILVAFAYANPIPEEEPAKESPVTTELPGTTEPAATTLATENAELKMAEKEETKEETEMVIILFKIL